MQSLLKGMPLDSFCYRDRRRASKDNGEGGGEKNNDRSGSNDFNVVVVVERFYI